MFKDEDNIYVLAEEDDLKNSGERESLTSQENEETDQEEGDLNKIKSPFWLTIKILLNPIEGWKELRRSKISPEEMQSKCFYPLLSVLALCQFAQLIYTPHMNLSNIIVGGLIAFVSYFFGYFASLIFLRNILPEEIGKVFETSFGKTFIMVCLSTLSLFSIFTELIPMLWPILIFLPLWTIYVICRGIRFFKLPEKGVSRFTILICISVIGFPLVIDWLLNTLLPL